MLQHVMTDETFAKGLNLYLTDKSNSAATPADLYRNMQEALDEDNPSSGINIADFMSTWELQGGYPMIHVSRNESILTITQSKYLQNSLNDPSPTKFVTETHRGASRWTIPSADYSL